MPFLKAGVLKSRASVPPRGVKMGPCGYSNMYVSLIIN